MRRDNYERAALTSACDEEDLSNVTFDTNRARNYDNNMMQTVVSYIRAHLFPGCEYTPVQVSANNGVQPPTSDYQWRDGICDLHNNLYPSALNALCCCDGIFLLATGINLFVMFVAIGWYLLTSDEYHMLFCACGVSRSTPFLMLFPY